MSFTSADSLLRIMSVRHAMHLGGATQPAPAVRDATEKLVQTLADLDPAEAINVVVIAEEPLHAQYVRVKTGELLAQIKIAGK